MSATPSRCITDAEINDDVLPSEVDMLCAGDRPAQPVEWLWPGRIPIGKVTLLVGDPGHGKSLVALDVAARVSRGATWPEQGSGFGVQGSDFEPHDPHLNPPRSVLILSSDDDLADTIRARLDAAQAEPHRVFVLPALVDLRNEFAELRAAVDRLRDCRLIIIDPINAYVGPADSHFHTVVRRVLAPLARLATEKRIAVLAVTHLRKCDAAAIRRAAGSMGFVAVARAVWTVCRDHANPDRRLFLPLKNNLAAAAGGLAFSIESRDPTAAPAIVWEPNLLPIETQQTAAPPPKPPGPEALERNAAGEWLRETLADGPRSAWDVSEEAAERGISQRTLRRALHAIGGKTQKGEFFGGWMWSLPEHDVQQDKPPHPLEPGPFAATWPLGDRDDGSARLDASMAALDRILRHRHAESNTNPQRPPPPTAHSILLDRFLKSFGDASSVKLQCPHQNAAHDSYPPAKSSGTTR